MAENVEVLLKLRGSRQFVAEATAAAMGVEKIGDETETTSRKFETAEKKQGRFMGAMKKLGPVVMTGVSALGAIGVAAGAIGVKYNASMEQTRVAFKQFLGSAGAADEMIKRLQDLNKATPFEFPELAGTTKRLLAMGFSAEDAVKQTQTLADAVAGIGGGGAELDRASLAIGQIASKGKLSAEDLMQLTELGMVGMKDLAKQFNMSGGEFAKAMSKGEISSNEALTAINKVAKTNFGGAAAAQSKTFAGQISNLKDSAQMMLGEAMQPLFEYLRTTALPALSDAIPQIQGVATALGKTLVTAIQGVTTAVKFMVANWNTIKTIAVVLGVVTVAVVAYTVAVKAGAWWTLAITKAQAAWAAVMALNPVGLLVAALVLLVIGIVVAYKKFAWFRNLVQGTWAWIKDHWRLLVVLLTGPLGVAVVMIVNHWKEIKAAAKPVIDWLITAWGNVIDVIKDVAHWIGQLPWDKVGKVLGVAGKIAGGAANAAEGVLGHLASGGTVQRTGPYLVGERGPEVVSLSRGATVYPSPNVTPLGAGLLEPRSNQAIVTKVYIGKRQVAEAVGDYMAERKARR